MELSVPHLVVVALATTSITGFLFSGGKKLTTKLGQEVSRRDHFVQKTREMAHVVLKRPSSSLDLFRSCQGLIWRYNNPLRVCMG